MDRCRCRPELSERFGSLAHQIAQSQSLVIFALTEPIARNPAERRGLRHRNSKSQIASDFHRTLRSQCKVSEIASDFWGPRWASQSQKSLRFRCGKFGSHWSIRISRETHMGQWPFASFFREIRMDQKVRRKFPPRLVLVQGWLFPALYTELRNRPFFIWSVMCCLVLSSKNLKK